MSPLAPAGLAPRELLRAATRHRGLLAAGLAAAAVATALPALAPAAPATVPVLAAARDLAGGVALTASDLQVLALPAAAAPTGALRAPADAVGRLLSGPVRPREPLTDARLVGPGLLDGGDRGDQVATPVRLADGATATLLHAGDAVDVLAVPVASTPGPQRAAEVVAAGVRVLAVPLVGAGDVAAGGDGALVVLATSPQVATRLATAAVTSRLSVTLLAAHAP